MVAATRRSGHQDGSNCGLTLRDTHGPGCTTSDESPTAPRPSRDPAVSQISIALAEKHQSCKLVLRQAPLLVRFRYRSYKRDASWGNPRADARASTRPQDGRRVRARFVAAPRPRHAPQMPASSRCRALRHGLVEGKSVSKQVEPNQRPRILRAGAPRRASRAARGEEHYRAAADESLS